MMCRPRKQRDEDDGWYAPERVAKRVALVQQINHDRRLERITEEWDKHQSKEKRSGRIHMRPIGYKQKYTDTVAYADQNYALTKTSFAVGEHNCNRGVHSCYVCGEYLPCDNFRRDRTRSCGLMSKCRYCNNLYKAGKR